MSKYKGAKWKCGYIRPTSGTAVFMILGPLRRGLATYKKDEMREENMKQLVRDGAKMAVKGSLD